MIELNKTEAKIYNLILNGAHIVQDIAEAFGVTRSTVNKTVKKLEEEGAVIITGRGSFRRVKGVQKRYVIVTHRTANKTYTAVKKILKQYGSDTVRYIMYRSAEEHSFLAAKTGLKVKDVKLILMRLGA